MQTFTAAYSRVSDERSTTKNQVAEIEAAGYQPTMIVQEEAVSLGVPVLVLSAATERQEILAAGYGRLVGIETGTIVAGFDALADDAKAYAAMRCPSGILTVMLTKFLRALGTGLAFALMLMPSLVSAECLIPSAELLKTPIITHVFSGTVRNIYQVGDGYDGQHIVFDVDRVWKGQLSDRVDVYTWPADEDEARGLEVGKRYVVSAGKINEREKRLRAEAASAPTVAGDAPERPEQRQSRPGPRPRAPRVRPAAFVGGNA